MRKYKINAKYLLLIYSSDYGSDFIEEGLDNEGVTIANTFTLKRKNLIEFDEMFEEYTFAIGVMKNDLIELDKEIFGIDHNFYLSTNYSFKDTTFVQNKMSVIRFISNYAKDNVYVTDNKNIQNRIPVDVFKKLISIFPNSREIFLYRYNVIDTILSEFFNTSDYIEKYNKYVNNHRKINSANKIFVSKDYEFYEAIYTRLLTMLNGNYSELEWQREILPIILLLYPKYILCLKEVIFKDVNNVNRRLDYLLVDSAGNIDIIELKKPDQNIILKHAKYRDNYVEHNELSGAIMQCEKYIYNLTSNKIKNEEILNAKYSSNLAGLKLKINNPKALIFMGRTYNFDDKQKEDFQIIKRKYSNIVDILSYDDLLERLKNTLNIIKVNTIE